MIDPGTFREAILALTTLGGGAFAAEYYVRHKAWPPTNPKGNPRDA